MVQVSIKITGPKQIRITKKVLGDILQRLVDRQPIPPNVEVRGIFWRNPSRRGALSEWRYHSGADLTNAPSPIEDSPRGSLQDAIDTLAPFLSTGRITFQ